MMHSAENNRGELAYFVRKVAYRLIVFTLLLVVVFFIPIPRNYFFSSMEKTIHSKLSWVWRKINNTSELDNTIVFVGSSVCFYGINDSLLTTTDTTGVKYLNLGVVHHCNDISDAMLHEMIAVRKLKPQKVILCLKTDALARDVHHMYPLAARPTEIGRTLKLGNTQFLPTALKRVAWNMNYFTGNVKMNTGEDSLYFHGAYGFEAQAEVDPATVEKKYKAQREGMEAIFSFLENNAAQKNSGIKDELLAAKRDYFDNEYFQCRIFEQSARLLDQHNIPYDILLYPNLAACRAGKEEAMVNYAMNHLQGIDFSAHPILVVKDPQLADSKAWVDMNHLSAEGAAIFSQRVRDLISSHD